MGYYINEDSQGNVLPAHGKADLLIADGATEITEAEVLSKCSGRDDIVCVVDNGPFEAAGYAYSNEELGVFLAPDGGPQRPRRYLLYNHAAKLSGYQS